MHNPESSAPGSNKPEFPHGQIGLVAAVAIGIGGMLGAGIFSILGVVAEAAGNAMWLSFLAGGVVGPPVRLFLHQAGGALYLLRGAQ